MDPSFLANSWLVPFVPAAVLVLAVLISGGARGARRRRWRGRRDVGVCVRCGYDLTGNVSCVCPECGQLLFLRGRSLFARLECPLRSNALTEPSFTFSLDPSQLVLGLR